MTTAREAFDLYRAGRMAEAAALCERLVFETPSVEAWHILGVARIGLNQPVSALEALDAALALDPKRPGVLSARALVLNGLGRDEEAVVAAAAAIAADPKNPSVFNALGVSLRRLGRPDQALAAYEAALAAQHGFVDALCNRGVALTDLGRFDEAGAALDQAVQAAPREPKALANRAALKSLLNRPMEAARDLEAVLELDPLYPRVTGDLMWARRQACNWDEDAALDMLVKAELKLGRLAIAPFAALAIFGEPVLHRRCAQLAAPPPAPAPVWPVRPVGERLRIAYLSADLHEHATARLLAGVLEAHDRGRFEVFAVSYGPDTGGPMRERLKTACEHWIDARSLTDQGIAAHCRDLGTDIAIDLKGYTQDGRPGILAHRAAPVQVSWLGYPGTLGAHADYVIADAVTIPFGAESDWSEAVVRLPLYQPNDALGPVIPAPSRAKAGLPEDVFVFCCFNNPAKITPQVFAAWTAILKAAPHSVLWLYSGAPGARENLENHAVAAGLSPGRLIFADPAPHAEHLARHALADLVLDTWPYGAHTTASDALRMAIPVLTLPGRSFASRVGASLLTALELPELIAADVDDYVGKAVDLATGRPALDALKARLAKAVETSSVFDPTAFARSLEAALAGLVRR